MLQHTIPAYVYDVIYRPAVIAQKAHAYAAKKGKPVINVGAGTPQSSLRVRLFGPQLYGDINCDLNGKAQCTPKGVCQCDIMNLKFPNKYFGAAIASHVIEHVPDPQKAVRELMRVADAVYIIVPLWWAPHTWLYTDHKWYVKEIDKKGNLKMLKLWS